jgi:hypothetical protein
MAILTKKTQEIRDIVFKGDGCFVRIEIFQKN